MRRWGGLAAPLPRRGVLPPPPAPAARGWRVGGGAVISDRVWVVGLAEAEAAADTVLEVVDRAGVVRWLAPEPVDVLRLRGDVRVLVRYAVDHGVVHLADDRSAVAV